MYYFWRNTPTYLPNFIFSIKEMKPKINFCSQSYTNIHRILTKHRAPQAKIKNLRLSHALKLSLK